MEENWDIQESFVIRSRKMEIIQFRFRLGKLFSEYGYKTTILPKVYDKSRVLFTGKTREYCLWIHPVFGIKVKLLDCQKTATESICTCETVIAKYVINEEGNFEFQFGDKVLEENPFIQALTVELRIGAGFSESQID